MLWALFSPSLFSVHGIGRAIVVIIGTWKIYFSYFLEMGGVITGLDRTDSVPLYRLS